MSRIGKLPIEVPVGVTVTLGLNNLVTVQGPKGELYQQIHRDMRVEEQGGTIIVTRPTDNKMHKSLHGLSRSLIANMVDGVTKGYKKNLELNGVGYRAQKQGKKLVLLSLIHISEPTRLGMISY